MGDMGDSSPVLVVGGTRATGLLAVRLLKERGVQVRVLAREPSGVEARTGPGVSRADVADILVETLRCERAFHATFEVAWGSGPRLDTSAIFRQLRPDASMA